MTPLTRNQYHPSAPGVGDFVITQIIEYLDKYLESIFRRSKERRMLAREVLWTTAQQGRFQKNTDGKALCQELGISEDQKISRLMTKFGRISHEKCAGVFTRTHSRVSEGFDIAKSLGYAIKGSTYYIFPGLFKYRRHALSI